MSHPVDVRDAGGVECERTHLKRLAMILATAPAR
jgi:hypothetical protein